MNGCLRKIYAPLRMSKNASGELAFDLSRWFSQWSSSQDPIEAVLPAAASNHVDEDEEIQNGKLATVLDRPARARKDVDVDDQVCANHFRRAQERGVRRE